MSTKTKTKKKVTTIADTNPSTFLGKLDRPVQVNLNNEQKALLIKKAKLSGQTLGAYIRTAAIEKANQ